jgi:hypothetical protein
MVDIPPDRRVNSEWPEVEAMPPNPWKVLKTDELTAEQKRDLRDKLAKRQNNLKRAMDAIEQALLLLSRSLDQDGESKYSKKIKRKKK